MILAVFSREQSVLYFRYEGNRLVRVKVTSKSILFSELGLVSIP